MKKVLCLLLLINLCKLNSQTIEGFERISKHKFEYKNKIGKLHEFRDEFKSNPELFKDFKKFNACRKSQRFINYFGGSLAIAAMGFGLIIEPGFQEGNQNGGGLGILFGIGGIFAGGTVSLIGNATAGSRKVYVKNKLLKKMNLTDYSSHYESEEIQLELKSTNNGIGLVYTF